MTGTRRRQRRVVCLVAAALAIWLPALAHELGQTRALARFDADGTFAIDVLVDPQALAAQLELRDGRAPSPATDAAALIARITSRASQVTDGIEVVFDGRRVDPRFDYHRDVVPALAAGLTSKSALDVGTIRLTGRIPDGARTFAFSYRWTYGAIALMLVDPRGREPRTIWLGRGERSRELVLDDVRGSTSAEVFGEYLALGFTHILPKGLDHILFVLGLFFLAAGWRSMLVQVSTFTVAHSITLGLSMLGVVSLSPSIVEPLIALSIAYIALENLMTTQVRTTRLVLIFCFGLLHGMGFAGVLSELGIPASSFLTALFGFNLGVEAGQLTVLALATLAVAGWRRREASLLPLVARPASVAIALSGLYWMIERTWWG